MKMLEDIRKAVAPATLKENGGLYVISVVVAQRKVFLSSQKLEYVAKFRITEDKKEFKFTEMLREKSSGLAQAGIGFKKESYSSGLNGREGGISEQSKLFGKKYDYDFDYAKIRKAIENIAANNGYKFVYNPVSIV